ncbi:MAG: hypothetical protein RIQ89_2014 [Bacteroidota bacterium]|jgi:predicted alpha-1,2-mannosidase
MTKKYCLFVFIALAAATAHAQDFASFVNPMIGTGGHGHTFPGATVPLGMVQLSPDTRNDGSWDGCSGYHYSDSTLLGFSHTHLSGTGCSDYGDVLFLPLTESVSLDSTVRIPFSHSNEVAAPGYYAVKLQNGVQGQFTTTTRTGLHQYTFPNKKQSLLLIDLAHRDEVLDAELKMDDNRTITGYRHSKAWANNQQVFFAIRFESPYKVLQYYADGERKISELQAGAFLVKGKKVKVLLSFDVHEVSASVALSSVDVQGALKNLSTEVPTFDFEKVKAAARNSWNQKLAAINIEDASTDNLTIFYSALYHCYTQPNTYSDVDGKYRGRDAQIHTADGYTHLTVFSLWDTFRAWHPLMTLIDENLVRDMMRTFLAQYNESGMLPVWELSGCETECMIGYHSVSALADAIMKDIKGFDYNLALEAMKNSALSQHRFGLKHYIEKGYLDVEDEPESVSKTLEYGYDDWCIARVAEKLNKVVDASHFYKRSCAWRNLYDVNTTFIRPRKNGGWLSPFEPTEINNHYTEANGWQYHFFVPHDMSTLVRLTGGVEAFEEKINELLATEGTTGRDQADVTGLIGQYAHGNEPSHHISYLYNYTRSFHRGQQMIANILSTFYKNEPDGLIGNEDCGQMSAWFVLSSMGMYQVNPGSNYYHIGTPHFKKATIHLSSNKQIVMEQKGNLKTPFLSEVLFNGKPLSQPKLYHHLLMEGGSLVFNKTNTPTQTFKDPLVDSINLAMQLYLPAPIISASEVIFKNQTTISMQAQQGSLIHYTTDGSLPTKESQIYTQPFEIEENTTIKAFAILPGAHSSTIATAQYYKMLHADWKINTSSIPNSQYNGGGSEALIDGLYGDVNWRKGYWQGFQNQHFNTVIDLAKIKKIKSVSTHLLQDTRAWIIFPKSMKISFSKDGVNFTEAVSVPQLIAANDYNVQVQQLKMTFDTEARFVKIMLENFGALPQWHQGFPYAGQAFIFISEAIVETE